MIRTRFSRRLIAFVLTLSMVLGFGIGNLQLVSAEAVSPSQAYVQAMGTG